MTVMYPKPRDEYEPRVGVVVVNAGPHAMGISIEAENGKPTEPVQPRLVTLANAVVAKLR